MRSYILKVWRQNSPHDLGRFESFKVDEIPEEASFLEMLDILNNRLEGEGKDPVAFDSDCREGICGTCGMVIDGHAHGEKELVATCQLYMRDFPSGATITMEPFRAQAFPVIKDLVVDRSAFDRIIKKGGYVSVNTGAAPDGNAIPVPKEDAESAFDAAACIGCGACVASCKNASAMLFVSAKVAHLGHLPQGQPERKQRVKAMVAQMDAEGFGSCTNEYECEAHCPKGISVANIARMNRDYWLAELLG